MKQNQTVEEYIENHRIIRTQIYNDIYEYEHFINNVLKESYLYHKTNKNFLPRYLPKLTDDILNKSHFVDLMKLAKQKPIKDGDLYLCYYAGHILFDKDENPVPTLQINNYIGTPFHNGILDLKKAINHLKKHPWVKYVSDIQRIPYYNVDNNQDEYIEVHILPDAKTYKILYDRYKNNEHWSTRLKEALHDFYKPSEEHNLLGLYPSCLKGDDTNE